MILFTAGMEQYPFYTLLSWVNRLIQENLINSNEEIILQSASSSPHLAKKVRTFDCLPESEFIRLIKQARVVVSHCGEGSIMLLQSLPTPFILVPRSKTLGEHVDDHQLEMAHFMEQQGIPIARTFDTLVRFLKKPQSPNFTSYDESNLCRNLKERYDDQKYKRIMVVCSSGGHFKYAQSLQPFLDHYQHVCWVTFQTSATEDHFRSHDKPIYWAYGPTNRNIPNLFRNLFLAHQILSKEQPDLVISTGAGVSVPFLFWAKRLYNAKTVFIESKTRIQQLSLSALMLRSMLALDQLIVRSEKLANTYPDSQYIRFSVVTLSTVKAID